MKKALLFVAFLLGVQGVKAQQSNDWIKFSAGQSYSDQQYYRIPISKTGLYRISVQSLVGAGFKLKTSTNPDGFVDPKTLQLFAKGKEQPVYLKGYNGSFIDDNGYLEFFGEKNDGWYDRQLYCADKYTQINPCFS